MWIIVRPMSKSSWVGSFLTKNFFFSSNFIHHYRIITIFNGQRKLCTMIPLTHTLTKAGNYCAYIGSILNWNTNKLLATTVFKPWSKQIKNKADNIPQWIRYESIRKHIHFVDDSFFFWFEFTFLFCWIFMNTLMKLFFILFYKLQFCLV